MCLTVPQSATLRMTLPHCIVQISWPKAFVTSTRFTPSALSRRRIIVMMSFFARGVRWADVLDDDMACDQKDAVLEETSRLA